MATPRHDAYWVRGMHTTPIVIFEAQSSPERLLLDIDVGTSRTQLILP